MKIRYILAVTAVALFAIPGTASQLAAQGAQSATFVAPVAGASSGGAFDDPHVAPTLSIILPERFVAFDVGPYELQTFS